MTPGSPADEIRNLIHRYSDVVDAGRFDDLRELFEHAVVRVALGANPPGEPMAGPDTAATYRAGIRLYADGTPRTRHVVTNEIVEVDEAAGTATARSYNTTFQQAPGHGIEIIATARYEDAFRRIDGRWRFTERIIRHASIDGVHRDFIGDMSRHVNRPTDPPAAE